MKKNGARRRGRLTKENITVIILNALCVALVVCALVVRHTLVSPLFSQNSAVSFGGSEKYAQVSAFIADSAGLNGNDIESLRRSIDSKLEAASISAANEDARLYVDCYSLISKISVTSQRITGDYTAFVVGGDFFTFHPLKLKSGYYFSGSDIMQDRVVLDMEASWQLFGAYDVEGMQVRINDRLFIVAAVIEREEDMASEMAYSSGPAIYMSYDAYVEIVDSEARVTSYEVALPNPISGFALDIVSSVIGAPGENVEVVENTDRFGLFNLAKVLGAMGQRAMRTKPVFFPYWENAARLVEERAALLVLLVILLLLVPAATLVAVIVILWKGRRWHLSDIRDFYERKQDERWIKERSAAEAKARAEEEKRLYLPAEEYMRTVEGDEP